MTVRKADIVGATPTLAPEQIEPCVRRAVDAAPICDVHTHLYAPQFGSLLQWGIDELLTYHYLLAEFFRAAVGRISPEQFWPLPKRAQAELVWQQLFVDRSPISEAARGVITCLARLGLDPNERDLSVHRRYFVAQRVESHLDRVLAISGVRSLAMTNDPFDASEVKFWKSGAEFDSRFHAVLRLDGVLNDWSLRGEALRAQGYAVEPELGGATIREVRRFMTEWIARIKPLYLAASLPPEFRLPGPSVAERLMVECLLPVAAEHGLPVALMMGCRRRTNPRLRLAGDALGLADLSALANLFSVYSDMRFLVTVLARENQHELAVLARKFANLHVFGCWWFVNTASLVEEITRMRMELLGHDFTPQHSDARVLEQLIYKWYDARAIVARVLTDKYAALAQQGWRPSEQQIVRETADLLGGSALRFLKYADADSPDQLT